MSLIAFLTDYGVKDDYVGLLHASVLREDPSLHIVDLCHDIEPGNIEQAAFLLLHDSVYFPDGTVFVAVVDPGVGTERKVLVVEQGTGSDGVGKRSFVAPDNGLLDPLIHRLKTEGRPVQVYAAEAEPVMEILARNSGRSRAQLSNTFHGRDLLAPLGACIGRGDEITRYVEPVDTWVSSDWRPPRAGSGASLGRVMYADRFGNLITDIPVDDRDGAVVIFSRTLPRVRTFAEIPPGELAWLKGSKGTIEIVMNNNSAARVLRAERGEAVVFAEGENAR